MCWKVDVLYSYLNSKYGGGGNRCYHKPCEFYCDKQDRSIAASVNLWTTQVFTSRLSSVVTITMERTCAFETTHIHGCELSTLYERHELHYNLLNRTAMNAWSVLHLIMSFAHQRFESRILLLLRMTYPATALIMQFMARISICNCNRAFIINNAQKTVIE